MSLMFLAPPALAYAVDSGALDPTEGLTSEAPLFEPLSETEMADIEGGYCFGCRLFCGAVGIGAGLFFGNPVVGFVVGVGCIEVLDPEPLG
ncbi:MAG: hypothetical protein IIB36_12020 [Gemmatimonadetes bacterium]|nr:hypothetical protein [Gemmatimonadota bacterium]